MDTGASTGPTIRKKPIDGTNSTGRVTPLSAWYSVLVFLCWAALSSEATAHRASGAGEFPPLDEGRERIRGIEAGLLLIADEGIQDPRFDQAVVLLVRHSSNGGTLGLVINRPTEQVLSSELPGEPDATEIEVPLFFGGPVHGRRLGLLYECKSSLGSHGRVTAGLCFAISRQIFHSVVRDESKPRYRVYQGHTGWAPGQLHAEIVSGSWRLAPFDAAHVFSKSPKALWHLLRDSAGEPPALLVRETRSY